MFPRTNDPVHSDSKWVGLKDLGSRVNLDGLVLSAEMSGQSGDVWLGDLKSAVSSAEWIVVSFRLFYS